MTTRKRTRIQTKSGQPGRKSPMNKSLTTLTITAAILFLPFLTYAADGVYSILFNRATNYQSADEYISKMDSKTAAQTFIQQKGPGEYWVLYGKMTKDEADKTFDTFVNQRNFKWVEIVQPGNTVSAYPRPAITRTAPYTPPVRSYSSGSSMIEKPSSGRTMNTFNRISAYPETVTNTFISNTYVNRIIAPYGHKIQDVVIEKDCGLQVKLEGRNAFLTFLKKKDTMTDEITYQESPVSIHVILEPDIVYTIIASPKQIESKTIELKYDNENLTKNLELFRGMPVEKKVVNLVKAVMTNTIPDSFARKRIDRELMTFKDIQIYYLSDVIVEGEGLRLKEFLVTLNRKIPYPIRLKEQQFMIPELSTAPLGIALEDLTLNQTTTKTRLFIVEKSK